MSAEESWVEVRDYDPSWTKAYEGESTAIKLVLGENAVAIEHFGSTSVPGLAAKPIIDILVGTLKPGISDRVVDELSSLGYEIPR